MDGKDGRVKTAILAASDIPRGVEVLLKKAAVDAAFKDVLLSRRAGAAEVIGLKLDAAEKAMLEAIPADQLARVVAGTRVSPHLRGVFLSYTAAVMLAALAATAVSCDATFGHGPGPPVSEGIRPDDPSCTAAPAPRPPAAEEPGLAGPSDMTDPQQSSQRDAHKEPRT